jgi:hypothetical protein
MPRLRGDAAAFFGLTMDPQATAALVAALS